MLSIHFILRFLGLICFFFAWLNRPAFVVSMGWLGVFLWALGEMIR